MAWEWLDTVEGLEGNICEIGGVNTTWDYALSHIGNPMTYGVSIATSNNYQNPPASLVGNGEGAFFHNFESTLQTATYTTDWGFEIKYTYQTGTGGNTQGNISWSHDGRAGGAGGLNMRDGIRFAVDHSRQIAVMVLARYFYNGAYYCDISVQWSEYYNPTTQQRENTAPYLYQILMEHQPPQYVWSSVPAISGKNGILSLATLKASKINDGEAISDGSASDFSSLPSSSKISVLVAAVMPEDPGNKTSVVVTYYIGSLESGEYTLAKVAAKKNSIPESLEDADVVMDIPAESGKYSVGSLDELTKYYFVIFVADSNGNNATSNPESIRTGEIVAPFREEVVVEKKTGNDQYTLVYTWTGKWGKQDDTIAEGFETNAFDVLLEEELQLVENFEESYAENNWISEAQDAEIQI